MYSADCFIRALVKKTQKTQIFKKICEKLARNIRITEFTNL